MRSRWIGLFVALATLCSAARGYAVPPRAGAIDASSSEPWAASFEEGRRAYGEGRFEDAAAAFHAARALGGPVSLLYNEALCLDEAGRIDAAIAGYRAYLGAAPDAPNGASVASRVASLEAGRARGDDPRADAASRRDPLPEDPAGRSAPGPLMELVPLQASAAPELVVIGEGRPIARRIEPELEPMGPEWTVSWFFLVGALASTAATIGVWVSGQAEFDDLRAYCREMGGCDDATIAESSAHASELATSVLLATSAVLGATTALSFLIEGVATTGTRVYVEVTPTRLALRGVF